RPSSGMSRSVTGTVVQFAGLTKKTPTTMTNSTTPTLVMTSTAFVVALSRIPMTRTTVTKSMMATAGKLNSAPLVGSEKGSDAITSGILIALPDTNSRSLLRYLDQDEATTPQAMAYSRIKSQPMIQANSSPRVA